MESMEYELNFLTRSALAGRAFGHPLERRKCNKVYKSLNKSRKDLRTVDILEKTRIALNSLGNVEWLLT
jgi:hypothetical protein